MSDQSRLNDQNRIRSVGTVRRHTLDDLDILLLNEQRDSSVWLAEKAAAVTEHTRGDGPLRGVAVASAGGLLYAAPRIDTPTIRSRHAMALGVLKALSDVVDKVVAAAVYAEDGKVSVCGTCRQLLADYGSDAITVRGVVEDELVFEAAMGDMLPDEP